MKRTNKTGHKPRGLAHRGRPAILLAGLGVLAIALLAGCPDSMPSSLLSQIKERVGEATNSAGIKITQAGTAYDSWGSPYHFNPVLKDQAGTPVTFRIENRGTAALSVASVVLSNPSDFSGAFPAGPYPITIGAGEWKEFSLTFTPKSVGTIDATVTITSDDPKDHSYVFNIAGIGLQLLPDIQVLQSSIPYPSGGTAYDFGSLPSTVTGSPVTFTVQNNGMENLIVSAVSLADTANFNLSATSLPWTIAPAATRSFTVAFSPDSVGSKTSYVALTSNDPDQGTYILNLAGTATARQTISVSSSSPANGATDVRIDTNIAITFSANIDPATASGTTIKNGATNLPFASSYDSGTRTLTLNPTADLPVTSSITVTLPNTITGYNYELFNTYALGFTTGYAWHDGNTVFVSMTGSAGNPGTKASPLKSIQDGVNKAVTLGYHQVYVADGTYTYSNGGVSQSSTASLTVDDGMTVIGGWNSAFQTTSTRSILDAENNSNHVLWIMGSNVVVKNLTLNRGKAVGPTFHAYGGGVYLYNDSSSKSTVTLENLWIENNQSYSDGGGMCIGYMYTNVTVKDSTVTNNNAYDGTSYKPGGGISVIASNITFNHITVTFNKGYHGGISIGSGGNNITINGNNGTSFIYRNQSVGGMADGINIWGTSNVTLDNVYIYAENKVALYVNGNSGSEITTLVIKNCQFSSWSGGSTSTAIYEGMADVHGHTITNCTFLPNYLQYLYHDHDGSNTTDDAAGIAILNTANHTNHDASTVGGNSLVF